MTKFPTVSEAVIDPAEFQGNASKARSRLHSHAHADARSIPAAPSSLSQAPAQPHRPSIAFVIGAPRDARPRRAHCFLRPPAHRRPSSDRSPSDGQRPQLKAECQGAPKKVTPGAAAPRVTWKWPLPATPPRRVDRQHRCTRAGYGRWVSRSARSARSARGRCRCWWKSRGRRCRAGAFPSPDEHRWCFCCWHIRHCLFKTSAVVAVTGLAGQRLNTPRSDLWTKAVYLCSLHCWWRCWPTLITFLAHLLLLFGLYPLTECYAARPSSLPMCMHPTFVTDLGKCTSSLRINHTCVHIHFIE